MQSIEDFKLMSYEMQQTINGGPCVLFTLQPFGGIIKKRPKRKIEKSSKNLIEIDYGEIAFDIDV